MTARLSCRPSRIVLSSLRVIVLCQILWYDDNRNLVAAPKGAKAI